MVWLGHEEGGARRDGMAIVTRNCFIQIKTDVSSRYKQKTTVTGTQAMQEALEEKQQHIESLLQERDQERSEMMEVNMSAAEKQAQISQLQELYDNVSRVIIYRTI